MLNTLDSKDLTKVKIVDPKQLLREIEKLQQFGINLFSVIRVNQLPLQLQKILAQEGWPAHKNCRLILMGHGGKKLWSYLSKHLPAGPDPIDYFCADAANQFASNILGQGNFQLLYPGNSRVPLQQLGEIAGWHHPSPMGIGIQPKWGLWYAYRALLVTNIALEPTKASTSVSPCLSCIDKACLSACPASAIALDHGLALKCCVEYRLSTESLCSDRCLARLACPQSVEHQYSMEQVNYHYRHSLGTLKKYYQKH